MFLTSNPPVTCDIINSNHELAQDWFAISANLNLTEEFIRKYISRLNLNQISDQLFITNLNFFKKEYNIFIKHLCKKFLYLISVKMYVPMIKCYYYIKDMQNLFAPNILNYI